MTDAEPIVERLQIHPKFLPLMYNPHTIADIHGGRYGMKTECVHRIAINRAMNENIRVVCARETLQSIKDSSLKTISDIIYQFNLSLSQGGPFEVLSDRIVRREGDQIVAEFIFIGVRENIRDKKSLANVDLMIFDEAGKCSEDTLNVFLPTIIRKAGCKAWFIWNPESTADPVWKWFNGSPGPSSCIHIETSYLDNKWLAQEAINLILDCQRDSPELYEHLYLGKPMNAVKGAVYAAELKDAEENGRITKVGYDRTIPVHTFWDLGHTDHTCIWFGQIVKSGQFRLIDFIQNNRLDLSWFLIEMQERATKLGYVYGIDYLPHDGVDAMTHKKLTGASDKSPEMILRAAGRKVRIVPKNYVLIGISAARAIFPNCYFDADRCSDGLMGLRNYQWDAPSPKGVEKREPLHNWASHPADAFRTFAMAARMPKEEIKPVQIIEEHSTTYRPFA